MKKIIFGGLVFLGIILFPKLSLGATFTGTPSSEDCIDQNLFSYSWNSGGGSGYLYGFLPSGGYNFTGESTDHANGTLTWGDLDWVTTVTGEHTIVFLDPVGLSAANNACGTATSTFLTCYGFYSSLKNVTSTITGACATPTSTATSTSAENLSQLTFWNISAALFGVSAFLTAKVILK